MPTQKIVTLYEYDELPTDAAKSRARDWFRTATADDQFYAEYVQEDFESVCDAMGIDLATARRSKRKAVYWSGFWSQGDGASFEGTFAAKPDAGEAIRAYAPQDETLHAIGDTLAALSKRFPDVHVAIVQGRYNSHYVHENTMSCDIDIGEDEEGDPLDVDASLEDEVTETMRDLARWLYRTLEAEYDADNADDAVADNIRANEYTFTEDGNRED